MKCFRWIISRRGNCAFGLIQVKANYSLRGDKDVRDNYDVDVTLELSLTPFFGIAPYTILLDSPQKCHG